MAAHAEREGASAPSLPMCRQCGRRTRWTVKHRGQIVVVSEFCPEHSQLTMFDTPAQPVTKPKRAPRHKSDDEKHKQLLSQFHTEVRRQRRQRKGLRP